MAIVCSYSPFIKLGLKESINLNKSLPTFKINSPTASQIATSSK